MRGMRALAIGGLCAVAIGFAPVLIQAAPEAGGWGALIEAYNDCGQRLFQAFAKKPGNMVLSPYSIGTAMAMALVGARGENEVEMARVLGLELPRDEVNAANAAVLASLNRASSASFQLRAANALMQTKQGGAISEDYVAVLRKNYAAEVFRGANVATVNAWVREKTGGKIDSILGRIDPMTALVLIDAIYFKAPWQKAFDAKATLNETFHPLKGEAKVPMMHMHNYFALADRPGYRAIRLSYTGERVSMVVVLPDAGIADVVQRLDGNEMRLLLAALHKGVREVDLSLPRFKANFEASLVEPFMEMGMHRAFDLRTADFSGMTGRPPSEVPLAINQIRHRAVIDVAEQGTEAAAATGIGVVATAARPRPETFQVDRPFLFVIVDDETAAILFEGLIVDPRQAS
ncbi:MAG: serpin family protein [Xanthobacteraceae bacterium]